MLYYYICLAILLFFFFLLGNHIYQDLKQHAYVKYVIPYEKRLFVFWANGKIFVTSRDKIFQSVRTIGSENANKFISEIKIPLSKMIFEEYQKEGDIWKRMDY